MLLLIRLGFLLSVFRRYDVVMMLPDDRLVL